MREILYVLTFEDDNSSYYFHELENARKMLMESWIDDHDEVTSDEIDEVQRDINMYNLIDEYAYITTEFFEDER